jgi:hypothetical protein
VLSGDHVVLRPTEPEHLPNYMRWFGNRDVLTDFGPIVA